MFLTIGACCLFLNGNAQNRTITGTVTDRSTQAPVEFLSVSTLNYSFGETTDGRGNFTITVPGQTDTLLFSHVGYQPMIYVVNGDQDEIKISLSPSILTLDQAVITASRDEQLRSEVPVAISKIGSREIKETNATQLDQLLNRIPGVNMVDLGNEQHAMAIRQPIATNGVFLYMEDGIPIRPTGAFNHNALIEINHATMSGVEVVRGPVSSLYGAEAVGGAINFLNKQPTLDPSGRVALQGNTNGFRRFDAEGSNTFNKLGVFAGASYSGRRDGFRDNSDYDKYSATARAVYALNSKTRLRAAMTYINYSTSATVSADSADFFNRRFPSQFEFAGRDVSALRANAGGDHRWNNKNTTDFTMYMRNNHVDQNASHTVRLDSENPLRASSEISRLAFTSYGAILRHKVNFDWLNSTLTGGVSFDYSPTDITRNYIDVKRNEAGAFVSFVDSDSLLANSRTDLYNAAAFAQYTIKPIEKLSISISGRFDNIVYDYDNFLDSTAFSGAPDSRDVFQAATPKLGAVYNLNPSLGLYANYSIGFLPPQISDLYRGVKVPVLQPATYTNYEMGTWFRLSDKATLEVNIYQLDGENEIIAVNLPNGERVNQNARKTRHRGVEYALTITPNEEWKFQFTGSNSTHEFIAFPDGGENRDGKKMPGAPDWLANANLNYYPAKIRGLYIGIEWMHVGEYFLDNANSQTYEGYDIFNFRTGYQWKSFEVWCNVMNLTDKLYSVSTTLRNDGKLYQVGEVRSLNLGLAYNF